jgi:hypothetical protein
MIKLDYILKRNKSNIKTFCLKNKLTSYSLLLEYCKQRKFIPCTEEEFKKSTALQPVKSKVTKKIVKLENIDHDQAKQEAKPKRQNSNSQKARKSRSSNKRKSNSSRVLDSNDDGKN